MADQEISRALYTLKKHGRLPFFINDLQACVILDHYSNPKPTTNFGKISVNLLQIEAVTLESNTQPQVVLTALFKSGRERSLVFESQDDADGFIQSWQQAVLATLG